MTASVPQSIEIDRVSKSYGEAVALHEVSVDVPAGQFVAILGPSGSGKTTLLNIFAGLTTPDTGEIRVGDRDITKLSPQRRHLGFVFQNYALFPHMTVFDNIAFPLRAQRLRGTAEVKARVAGALRLVQLEGLEDRMPPQLSGGQQQRVAIARAIVYEPGLLLMDEPLGALDKALREHMQVELRRLQQRIGITTMYVTHDQEEALSMADLVVVIHLGRVEQVATPRRLYENPASLFVATFVGTNNCMPAVAASGNGEKRSVRLNSGHTLVTNATQDLSGEGSVCIRPEHVQVASSNEHANVLSATIRATRYVGSMQEIYVNVGTDEIIVRVDSAYDASPGDEILIRLPPEYVSYFEDKRSEPESSAQSIGAMSQ